MTLSVSTVHDWAAAAATTTTTASILALLCISSRPPLLFSTKIDKPLRLLLIRSTGGGGKVDWRIKKVHKKHTEDTSERGGESCVQMQFLNNYWRRQQMAETNFYFNTFLDVQEEEDKGQFRECPHLCNSTKFKRDQSKVVHFPDGPTTSTTLFVAPLMVTRRSHRNPKHPPTLWN